jgi:thioredoxin reductase (NADPH)
MSGFAKEVNILIHRDSLKQTAASYLVEYISKFPNIKVIGNSEVVSASGNNFLESIKVKNTISGEVCEFAAKALFIYIGAKPGTGWLGEDILKDEKGYVVTGTELMKQKSFGAKWKLEREPYLPESCIPGIFASGDVRAGAQTGISSAVGEGALAIRFVRKYLQEM